MWLLSFMWYTMVDREIIREVHWGASFLSIVVGIILTVLVWIGIYLFVTGSFGNEPLVDSNDQTEIDLTVTPPSLDVDVVE